jgi:hypothetical protein
MLAPRDQNEGHNREIKIGNRSFENVSQFKYLGTIVTYQNLIQEEITRRLIVGNACCHSFQSLPESSVCSPAVEKYKDLNIQDHNFACDSIWV